MPDLQKAVAWEKDNALLILLIYIIRHLLRIWLLHFLALWPLAHVCASVPNFLILEWQSYFHTDPMFKEIVKYDGEWVKDSFITLSEKPGIGVEINEEGMKKYAIAGIPFFE